MGAHDVNSVRRKLFVVGGEIGGWKSELSSQPLARHYGAKHGESPAEKPAGAEPKKHEPKPGELHAGGAVTAVDATTITVGVHPAHDKK